MGAASALNHRLPGHAVYIPRVLIRNQALLVPAEFRLATLLYDRMEREERFVPIPDQEWTQYTGLDPRSKELAIRGLKEKSLLKVEGVGQKARYCSDTRGFMKWAADVDRSKKPRTAGRGVTMKPGLKVHPECASGCAMLNQKRETGFVTSELVGLSDQSRPGLHIVSDTRPVSLDAATKESSFAKPVSRSDDGPTRRPRHLKRRLAAQKKAITPGDEVTPSRVGPVNAGASGLRSGGQEIARPVGNPLPESVQPNGHSSVQSPSECAAAFPLALARLAAADPLAGLRFLVRLLAAVQARHEGVTDSELAAAIDGAAAAKGRYQKSVGLFLETVPEVIGVRRRELSAESPPGRDCRPVVGVGGWTAEDQAELDRLDGKTPC